MRKMIRMTLSVMLAVLLILGALPIAASAADTSGTCGSGVNWEYSGGTLSITSSKSGGGTMDNYTASSDPPWVSYTNSITKITVKGVKKIGNYAFYGMKNLTSVEFKNDTDGSGNELSTNQLTNIGTYVFSFCSSLTELTFPKNLDGIGQHAFKDSGVTKLTFKGSSLSSAGSGTRQAFRSHSGMEIHVPDGFKLNKVAVTPEKYGSEPFYKNFVCYTDSSDKASVYWLDDDGSVLAGETVSAGTTPEYTDELEEKEDGAEFDHWDPTPSAVSANTLNKYTAVYTIPEYTVTWKNYNGTVLETDENVQKGTTPEYNGQTPFKPHPDANKHYAFSGWDPSVAAITGNTTYTAQFTECDNDPVSYVNANGEAQPQITAYKELRDDMASYALDDSYSSWWIVNSDVTVNTRITMDGDINLLLCDGATLNAPKGITVNDNNSLTVWQQSGGTGALEINDNQVDNDNAGIGRAGQWGNSGEITINGGVLTVTGGSNGAGIGGAYEGTAGEVTINGGNITATGKEFGAGIGGGMGVSGTVTINGGTVTANGGSEGGAGIGGGDYDSGTVTITGGTVTATGGYTGAGIGGGENGAGIVTITGGTVTATGGKCAAGIGSGYFERYNEDYNNLPSTVSISGGEITAAGGDQDTSSTQYPSGNIYYYHEKAGAGIGSGGRDGNDISISLSGGTITATKGDNSVGIGTGYDDGSNCAVTLTWTDDTKEDMSVTSDSYKGTVTFQNKFKDENVEGALYDPDTEFENSALDNSKLKPAYASAWQILAYRLKKGTEATITLDQDCIAGEDDAALELPYDRTVTLDLNGYTIDRNLDSQVSEGSVIILNDYSNLTIIDSKGGGVITGGNAANPGGGAILNNGTLTINGGTFKNNQAYQGGAIMNKGALTINGGTFTNNTATDEYGNGGAIYTVFEMTMNDGVITENSVTGSNAKGGGAIYSEYNLTINGGSVTDNSTYVGNGGVYVESSCDLSVSGAPVIKDNTSHGESNDLYIRQDKKINISDTLANDAEIGIRVANPQNEPVFTSGLNENGSADSFFSNWYGYGIETNNSGEAYLVHGVYNITVEDTKHGTVTADKETAHASDNVILTVTPDDDCELVSFTVKDTQDNEIGLEQTTDGYRFAMPADDVTVSAVFICDPIGYVDANGIQQDAITDYEIVKSDTETMSAGWYVVKENITNENRISVSGDVDLLLCDNAELTVSKGISVNSGNSLTIWRQSGDTGELTAGAATDSYNAAIGGNSGKNSGSITINGGNITATGSKYAAGIGGGNKHIGTVTVNAGNVTAQGGYHAAGVGGGTQGLATVTVNGGIVNATGGDGGAGIGAGYNNSYLTYKALNITINGGNVIATGGSGASDIGCGKNTTYGSCAININGGTVVADTSGIKSKDTGSKQGSIKLNWTDESKDTMSLTSASYSGAVTISKHFKDENGTIYYPTDSADTSALANQTLTPYKSKFAYHSLTLKGDIGVNYYLDLSAEELAQGVRVDFAWNGKSDSVTFNSESTAETRECVVGMYKATCFVYAAEMNDEITATITIGNDTEPIETDIYKVRDYADVIIANEDNKYSDELITLVKTMLNYGAGAQTQFDHNTDNLANSGVNYELVGLTEDEIRDIDRDVPDKNSMNSCLANEGIEYYGYSLILKTKTTLRFYFKKGSADYNKLVLLDTGDVNVGTVRDYNDQYCFIEVSDIPASGLDDLYELKFDSTSLGGFSALSYVKDVLLNDNGDQPITDTVTALYRYQEAAVTYFNSIAQQGGGQ